jgi:hypothetical protein
MFLKTPKPSTDQRVRSLLQKAARRGCVPVVELALIRLENSGDKSWLRSRAIVITFEECWPLASSLSIDREPSSKRSALLRASKAAKQKDAAGLGALAYAYQNGDHSMLDCVPEPRILRIVAEALQRPDGFFNWVIRETQAGKSCEIIRAAQQYLAAATWQWDKACILAGALLSTIGDVPTIGPGGIPTEEEFPYWVALDKHTPEGKVALSRVAKEIGASYRQLIWASFYCESAYVNRLLRSPWWEAEKEWRLRRAGLSLNATEELWSRARPVVRQYLADEAAILKRLIETNPAPYLFPAEDTL